MRQWWEDVSEDRLMGTLPEVQRQYSRKEEALMDIPDPNPSRLRIARVMIRHAWAGFRWSWPIRALTALRCYWTGKHSYEHIGSSAGPESGSEEWECKSCGAYHIHTYY